MDLKLVDVTLQADIGNFDGTGLELLTYLREVALTDLNSMLDLEMGIEEGEFEDFEDFEEFEDDMITPDEDTEEIFDREPSYLYTSSSEDDEINSFADEEESENETLASEIYDVEMGNKITKFAEVIKYFDSVIVTNGVVSDESAIDTMIAEFKKLDGIYNTYGDFSFSTSFTIA